MAYNTGNPIGSTDARDLLDNATNLDRAVNQSAARWTDRLGVSRPSWAGMVVYADRGAYVAGIEITGYNEIFLFDGEYYRAAASTSLPYTTTGSWSDDVIYFLSAGDAVLRSDLIAGLVGPVNGQINIAYFGTLEEARTNSDAIGKTIIVDIELTEAQSNITAPWPTDRALEIKKGGSIANSTEFTINGPFSAGMYQVFAGAGTVTGLKEARPEWFGVNTIPGTTDMAPAFRAAIAASRTVRFGPGKYAVYSEVVINTPGFSLIGDSVFTTTIEANIAVPRILSVYPDNPDSAAVVTGIALSGFTVDGSHIADTGIYVKADMSQELYKNITVMSCLTAGINHRRGWSNKGTGIHVSFNDGVGFLAGEEVNQCEFDIVADHNGQSGIVINGGDGLRLTGGSENNGQHGVWVNSLNSPFIHSLDLALRYYENNATSNKSLYSAIKIETAGVGNVIQGVKINNGKFNLFGESGIRVGPRVQQLETDNLIISSYGGAVLSLGSEYIDLPTIRSAQFNIKRNCNIFASNLVVETASESQKNAVADLIFSAKNTAFTPTLLTGGAAVGRTYTIQSGQTTTDGNTGTFVVHLKTADLGTSTGVVEIGGLPSLLQITAPVNIAVSGLNYTGSVVALALESTNAIRLYEQASGSLLSAKASSDLTADFEIWLSGSYLLNGN